jgi:hypothetical protein
MNAGLRGDVDEFESECGVGRGWRDCAAWKSERVERRLK